jgi:hypothetical protein
MKKDQKFTIAANQVTETAMKIKKRIPRKSEGSVTLNSG